MSTDQRYLRAAKGVAVPAHTDRTVLAQSIPNRGGNAHVHDHHLVSDEDHIPPGDVEERGSTQRGWIAMLSLSVIGLFALFGVMIARG